MERQTISLYINGSPHQVEIGPKTTLLEVLRDAGLYQTQLRFAPSNAKPSARQSICFKRCCIGRFGVECKSVEPGWPSLTSHLVRGIRRDHSA